MNSIKKIGVLTSGGDAPGMNAAIRAVVRACVFNKLDCVGIYRGYQGLIEGEFKKMNARSVKNIINRGGTILKSARSNDFFSKGGREVVKTLKKIRKNHSLRLTIISNFSKDDYATNSKESEVFEVKQDLKKNKDWITVKTNISNKEVIDI